MKRIDELTSEPPAGLIFMKKGISMNIHPVIRVDISDKVGDGKVISDENKSEIFVNVRTCCPEEIPAGVRDEILKLETELWYQSIVTIKSFLSKVEAWRQQL